MAEENAGRQVNPLEDMGVEEVRRNAKKMFEGRVEDWEISCLTTKKGNAEEQFKMKYCGGIRLKDVVKEKGKQEVVEHRQIIGVVFQKPSGRSKSKQWLVLTNLLDVVSDGNNGSKPLLVAKAIPREDDVHSGSDSDEGVEDHRVTYTIDDKLHKKIKASPYNWDHFIRSPI